MVHKPHMAHRATFATSPFIQSTMRFGLASKSLFSILRTGEITCKAIKGLFINDVITGGGGGDVWE